MNKKEIILEIAKRIDRKKMKFPEKVVRNVLEEYFNLLEEELVALREIRICSVGKLSPVPVEASTKRLPSGKEITTKKGYKLRMCFSGKWKLNNYIKLIENGKQKERFNNLHKSKQDTNTDN